MNNKVKSSIQNIFRKLSGGNKMQEEIDTLYYFLNKYADVSKAGPAEDPELRALQLLSTELLAIFDAVCRKHGLTYWLDYGTLLGAVRHSGFVPWDDDMDVAMPREDYNKVLGLLKGEMEPYGIIVRSGGYYDDRGPMERLAFAYKTLETGAWLDIFPSDHISSSAHADEVRDQIAAICDNYNQVYRKNHKSWSEEKFNQVKAEMFSQIPAGDNKIYFHGQEFDDCNDFIMDESEVFPLVLHKFEGYEFYIPKDADKYLKSYYGEYMCFPRTGVEHHLDSSGENAKTRARRHGIDMDAEIRYLHSVLEKI